MDIRTCFWSLTHDTFPGLCSGSSVVVSVIAKIGLCPFRIAFPAISFLKQSKNAYRARLEKMFRIRGAALLLSDFRFGIASSDWNSVEIFAMMCVNIFSLVLRAQRRTKQIAMTIDLHRISIVYFLSRFAYRTLTQGKINRNAS